MNTRPLAAAFIGAWIIGQTAAPLAAQPAAPKSVDVNLPRPSPGQESKLVAEVRDYAIHYTSSLPDFICLEKISRYTQGDRDSTPRLNDVLTARLTFFNQKEEYKLLTQNGRPVSGVSYASMAGPFSVGDFGSMMRQLFDPASHATFDWKKWTMLRGRRTHVFSYRMPPGASNFTIEFSGEQSEQKGNLQHAQVGRRGSVFVDDQFQTIVRIVQEAVNIPPSFPISHAEETLDYGFIKIGDREFFLPLTAILEMRSHDGLTRNVKEFQSYQKFSADAVMKFDSTGLPPAQPQMPQ